MPPKIKDRKLRTSDAMMENTSKVGVVLDVNVPPSLSAELGSDVTLPCTSTVKDSALNVNYLAFVWQFKGQDILTWNNKKKSSNARVVFNDQEARKGNATLVLQNVSTSDEGSYTCTAIYSPETQTRQIQLTVYELPIISNIKRLDDQLLCSVTGFYPKDIFVALLMDGKVLNSSVLVSNQNIDGTYSINISAPYTEMEKSKSFSCKVQHKYLPSPLEKHVQLVVEGDKESGLNVFLLVGILVALVFIGAIIGAVFYYRHKKGMKSFLMNKIHGPDTWVDGEKITLYCTASHCIKDVQATWIIKNKDGTMCEIADSTKVQSEEEEPLMAKEYEMTNERTDKPGETRSCDFTTSLSFIPSVSRHLDSSIICLFLCRMEKMERAFQFKSIHAKPKFLEPVIFSLCEPDDVQLSVNLQRFYPQNIQISWGCDGKESKEGRTSEDEINNNPDKTFSLQSKCKIPGYLFKDPAFKVRATWQHESMESPESREVSVREERNCAISGKLGGLSVTTPNLKMYEKNLGTSLKPVSDYELLYSLLQDLDQRVDHYFSDLRDSLTTALEGKTYSPPVSEEPGDTQTKSLQECPLLNVVSKDVLTPLQDCYDPPFVDHTTIDVRGTTLPEQTMQDAGYYGPSGSLPDLKEIETHDLFSNSSKRTDWHDGDSAPTVLLLPQREILRPVTLLKLNSEYEFMVQIPACTPSEWESQEDSNSNLQTPRREIFTTPSTAPGQKFMWADVARCHTDRKCEAAYSDSSFWILFESLTATTILELPPKLGIGPQAQIPTSSHKVAESYYLLCTVYSDFPWSPEIEDNPIESNSNSNKLNYKITKYFPDALTVTWCKKEGNTDLVPISTDNTYEVPAIHSQKQADGTFTCNACLVISVPATHKQHEQFVCRVEHPSLKKPLQTAITALQDNETFKVSNIHGPKKWIDGEKVTLYCTASYCPEDVQVTWVITEHDGTVREVSELPPVKDNEGGKVVPTGYVANREITETSDRDGLTDFTTSLSFTPSIAKHKDLSLVCRFVCNNRAKEKRFKPESIFAKPKVREPIKLSLATSGEVLCSFIMEEFYPKNIFISWSYGRSNSVITIESKENFTEHNLTWKVQSKCRVPGQLFKDADFTVIVKWKHDESMDDYESKQISIKDKDIFVMFPKQLKSVYAIGS
ncbi:uncharacterized protein LOC128641642 [Bombina bombina]|uniref:uncharacterized protein LOC128641642 n=1 Tax=Bombina bombina TaxID=8345 RepID=UPI00235AF110|nr:uncharacterized protein LOC128641642 [Bombina bombina]